MQYDMKIEEVSTIGRKLHFTVDSGEVKVELERAYRDLMRKVRIPGFRPGKVPRKMVEARYAPQVKSEVFGKLIEAAYREAVRELPVAGRPEVVDQGDVSSDVDLTFSIEVDFRPEITVKGHKGVAVDMPVAKVTKADIDRAIGQRLSSQARIEEVTDGRAVQAGDLVVTQLTLTQSGEELVNEPGTMIHTVAERYYPGVEPLLVGMKPGEEKSEEVTIGQYTENEDIVGETVLAKVKVITIQAHVVPELDDEVAKTLEFDNAKDMTAKIKAQLAEFAENTGKNQARVSVLEKLVEVNEFDVPQGMIDEQLNALMDELRMRQAYMGRDPSQMTFSDSEMADLRTRAEFAARASCVLDGVARQESIEVSDDDLEAKMAEMAEQRGQPIEAIKGYVEQEGAAPMLKARISEEKTLDWLLDNAKVTKVDPPKADEEPAKAKPAKKKAAKKKAAAPVEKAEAPSADWNKSMKKAELLDAAKAKGLSVNTKMTKPQIIEALENA
jgi:trigger factor